MVNSFSGSFTLISVWRNIRKLYSRNLDYALMKECDNYRLRGECALVRLGKVGGAELVLADDDAVAGQRVVRQAARGRQHVPK